MTVAPLSITVTSDSVSQVIGLIEVVRHGATKSTWKNKSELVPNAASVAITLKMRLFPF